MITSLKLEPDRENDAGEERARPRPSAALRELTPAASPESADGPPATAFARGRRRWGKRALFGTLILMAGGAAAVAFLQWRGPADSVLLNATERDSILQLEWEGSLAPVSRAAAGSIEIIENGAARKYDLSRADLRKGWFVVLRHSDDVTARLILRDRTGKVREEIARYVAAPRSARKDPRAVEIEQLRSQNEALRLELQNERARANELQSWAEVLENSLKKRAVR